MDHIKLSTKKELEIYMNPVRQNLLRLLERSKLPMTPKQLSQKLDISPSSVQHHIKKLESLGVIELDHTEVINGITARYYCPTYVNVRIGLDHPDDTQLQKEVLVQEQIARTYEGFLTQKKKFIEQFNNEDLESRWDLGDILTGVVHLSPGEGEELLKLIKDFLDAHAVPSAEKSPWEYAFILYNAEENLYE
ncbi:putative ArsR family transcriptional regulator [Lacrimispora xylanisolvens]|uniref:Putative ArsR family transcriptional regulator n=1 Tax=Lacrimispora xylanisolvens TaxID=384636 RepID=A0A2S6HZ18_9FIRM|nr:helix-turn-helix domain-containing protein [Hungatella xylanolytica]PPK83415.1 putative ArsR family transcriptional regulator [Hungatella xylanolytica]